MDKIKKIRVPSKKYGTHFIIVDSDDYDLVYQFKWSLIKSVNTFYAKAVLNGKTITVHRLILGFPNSLVDHKDRNGLNNCKDNLRLATRTQNNANRISNSNSTSKYKGVSWVESRLKWVSQIRVNGKSKTIGRFDSEIDAALSYNMHAKNLYGEFAYLNEI